MRLKRGEVTECSCSAYCQASDEVTFSAIRLPGYEGFISEGLYVIRSALPGAGVASVQAEPWQFHDKWVAEIWPNGLSDVTLAVAADGTGVLQGRMTGMIPSYLRGKCKGESSFSQTVRYAGVVAFEEDGVKFTPRAPVASNCTCPNACGEAPLEPVRRFGLLPFSRYLLGEEMLLQRLHEKRLVPVD